MCAVSVPESATLRSVLVRATDGRRRREDKTQRNARHAVRVTTHPCTSRPSISSFCLRLRLPPSIPFREPQPDNSRSFLFLHLLPHSDSTLSPPAYSTQYLALIVLPPASTGPTRSPKPEPEPEPAPARHRKTHSETRSSKSLPLPYIH